MKKLVISVLAVVLTAGLLFAGGVRYDESVTGAQMVGKSIVESSDGPVAEDIRLAWERIEKKL